MDFPYVSGAFLRCADIVQSDSLRAYSATSCADHYHFEMCVCHRVTVLSCSVGERMDDRIASVERISLWVPIVDRIRLEMERAGIHVWSEVEVIRVTTQAGISGWGETIQNYTWGRADTDDRVIGRSPFDLFWDDSLGAGLQMAVLDLAGKLADVPAHRLLGEQVRTHCPLSFWGHDMSPELYVTEALEAVRLGYNSLKIKARPWWDVHETIARISEVTPSWFSIDVDWNDFLLDAPTALPVLCSLESKFQKIKIFEGPIPADDIEGNERLRAVLRTPIAHHYAETRQGLVRAGHCDGYVIDGGVSAVSRAGHFASAARMPFFLQMVGTGLTAALCLHLGAVHESARWPAINVHELYEHNLLTSRISVLGGYAAVPMAPGLGVEVDEEALERYRVVQATPNLPLRVICYRRPSGIAVYFTTTARPGSIMWNYFVAGNQPAYEQGVATQLIEDDGSVKFQRLHERASVGPVVAGD